MKQYKLPLLFGAIVILAIGLLIFVTVKLAGYTGKVSYDFSPLTLNNTTAPSGMLVQQGSKLNLLDTDSGAVKKGFDVSDIGDIANLSADPSTHLTDFKVSPDGRYLAVGTAMTNYFQQPFSATSKSNAKSTIDIYDLSSGQKQTVVTFSQETALIDFSWDFSTPLTIGFVTGNKSQFGSKVQFFPLDMMMDGRSANQFFTLTRLSLTNGQATNLKFDNGQSYSGLPALITLDADNFYLVSNGTLTTESQNGSATRESSYLNYGYGMPMFNTTLALSPDFTTVAAVTSGGKIAVYFLKTKEKQEFSLSGSSSLATVSINGLAVSGDGKAIAFNTQTTSTGFAEPFMTNRLWHYNLDTRQATKITEWTGVSNKFFSTSYPYDVLVGSIQFSPNSHQLVAMQATDDTSTPLSNSALKFYDLDKFALTKTIDLGATVTRLIRYQ